VIAPDLPGYGESSSPAAIGYGIDEQVQRLHAFVDAVGLTRADFGGSSMGGQIVARYATRYPEEVASLWLVTNAGIASAPRSEFFGHVQKGESNPLIPTSVEQFRDLMNFIFTNPPFTPEAVIQVLAKRAVAAQALRRKQFRELVEGGAQLEEQIAGLSTPTHILWGAQDRVLNVGAVPILSRLLPNSSATVMADIGHLPMIEAPGESAADYFAFRDRLTAQLR
jgi:abhydrolase domain-containing protein 6